MRNPYEREIASRQRAADLTLNNINHTLAKRNVTRLGFGDAGGAGSVNAPTVNPETNEWELPFDGWTPDRDVVGEVNLG